MTRARKQLRLNAEWYEYWLEKVGQDTEAGVASLSFVRADAESHCMKCQLLLAGLCISFTTSTHESSNFCLSCTPLDKCPLLSELLHTNST